jgi:hypothetical protein
MTAPGAWAPPTRASHGVVGWARAAVIALLAALAVLIHHESVAVAIGPTSSPAGHVMTPGTVMPGSHAAPAAAVPTMVSAQSPACGGMTMQHCSAASLEVVKLVPPARSPAPHDLAGYEVVTSGPKDTRIVGRAPPDLSVLSQLRI